MPKATANPGRDSVFMISIELSGIWKCSGETLAHTHNRIQNFSNALQFASNVSNVHRHCVAHQVQKPPNEWKIYGSQKIPTITSKLSNFFLHEACHVITKRLELDFDSYVCNKLNHGFSQ